MPSKTLAKKCSLEKTVLNYSSWTFVRKSCLRSCRQHLNTIQKSTVQKSCPQHRQWSAFKKRPKLNARQNVIVEKCYSKHRYKLLSIGTLMEMLVKTYQLQKLPKKPPILTFQKKAVLTSSSKSTTQRFRPKHWQKVVPGKRLYWNTRHVLFPKEMTKPDSIYLLFGKVPDKHFAQNTDNQAQPKNERNGTLVKMLSLRNATQNTDEKRYL